MLGEAETVHALLNFISPHEFHKHNFDAVDTYEKIDLRLWDAAMDVDKRGGGLTSLSNLSRPPSAHGRRSSRRGLPAKTTSRAREMRSGDLVFRW
jgi:hypothetical protein